MIDEVRIFVYGSCHFYDKLDSEETIGNGGYGVVISVNSRKVKEISGGFSNTTNARMEILAITEGLKTVTKKSNIIIYLTNGYVLDTLTKGWLEKWKVEGFKKKKHVDLWIELDKMLHANTHTVSFKHSREVRLMIFFNLAEQLAKEMSAKQNLPVDLKQDDKIKYPKPAPPLTLFNIIEENGEIYNKASEISTLSDEPILDSICVDASAMPNPGPTEYRGMNTRTKEIMFSMKFDEATNNIGEFLAIVHALAFCKVEDRGINIIYTDSVTAIAWVRQKKCKTKYGKTVNNAEVFEHIRRAESWLNTNEYSIKVLKWDTKEWGQIPADYDRK